MPGDHPLEEISRMDRDRLVVPHGVGGVRAEGEPHAGRRLPAEDVGRLRPGVLVVEELRDAVLVGRCDGAVVEAELPKPSEGRLEA